MGIAEEEKGKCVVMVVVGEAETADEKKVTNDVTV